VYNVGLETWAAEGKYDLIWNQWCLGQLNDRQLEEYLRRCKRWVKKGGWVVVKENMSTEPDGEDVFDEVDSSVSRSDGKFRSIFEKVGLKIVAAELAKGMPAEIYPVRTYALQPDVWAEDEEEIEEE
jgi:protein N-terminal methyltransferase